MTTVPVWVIYALAGSFLLLWCFSMWLLTANVRLRGEKDALFRILASQRAPEAAECERETAAEAERRRARA